MTQEGPCPAFKGNINSNHLQHSRSKFVLSEDIGIMYGPFDLSMIPIWRGGSLSFISALGLRVRSLPSPYLGDFY